MENPSRRERWPGDSVLDFREDRRYTGRTKCRTGKALQDGSIMGGGRGEGARQVVSNAKKRNSSRRELKIRKTPSIRKGCAKAKLRPGPP